MRCCGVETLACLSLLRFPLFNTWGDTINTWRFPSNSTQCTDGLHAVTFRTPLIHSLRHTELLNCVKVYSMYKVVTYINSTILVFTHGAWMGQQKSSLFSVLRLQETQNRLSSTPRGQPQSWNDFYMFRLVSSLFLSSLHPLSFLC